MALEVELRENCAALRRQGFHAAKSALELGVGGAQRCLRIDIELAGQIGGCEQQIADFLENLGRCTGDLGRCTGTLLSMVRRVGQRALRGGRIANFGEFLGHLVGGLARMFEIKAHARRALAQLVGAHQRRQRLRHPIQVAAIGAGGGAALGRLDFFPRDALFGLVQRAACAEHVRVAPQQLVANGPGHRLEIELPRLARDLRVKHHLKQEIAEFVAQVAHVAAFHCVRDFIRLLDGVRRDGREGLRPIPWATVRGAQALHDAEQFADPVRRGELPGHCGLAPPVCNMRRRVINMPAVAPQMLRSP